MEKFERKTISHWFVACAYPFAVEGFTRAVQKCTHWPRASAIVTTEMPRLNIWVFGSPTAPFGSNPHSTSRIVILSLALAAISACSKTNSETFHLGDSSPSSSLQLPPPNSPRPGSLNADLLPIAIASAASALDPLDPSNDPAAALECPSTNDWSKFDAFAAPCAYAWTSDAQKLPRPPEWQPCSPTDGVSSPSCKKLKRSRRLKTLHVGTHGADKLQIGFVEPCSSDQIVLADIDGPTRFAMRRSENSPFPATCQMKLLAVDMGQWLASLGGHEIPTDLPTSGYSTGGAFLGGSIGSAPNVLFSQTSDPFHVATSQGALLPDGWTADGKRRHWNGKAFEKPPRIGLVRLTKHLLLDEKKGFYEQTPTEPQLLFEVPPGRTFVGVHIRDKHIVWQEHSGKTCTLMAGEIDGKDLLARPRRVADVPCTVAKFAVGCNTVLVDNDTHLDLVSLTDGTSRTLRLKGHPVAVHCQEAFVERAGKLLRIDLAAFSQTNAPALPPTARPTSVSSAENKK